MDDAKHHRGISSSTIFLSAPPVHAIHIGLLRPRSRTRFSDVSETRRLQNNEGSGFVEHASMKALKHAVGVCFLVRYSIPLCAKTDQVKLKHLEKTGVLANPSHDPTRQGGGGGLLSFPTWSSPPCFNLAIGVACPNMPPSVASQSFAKKIPSCRVLSSF